MGRGGGAWAVAGGVALVCVLLLPHYPPHQAQAHTTTGDEFLVTDADLADSKSPLETEHERLALHDLQGARFRNATTSCNVHIHVTHAAGRSLAELAQHNGLFEGDWPRYKVSFKAASCSTPASCRYWLGEACRNARWFNFERPVWPPFRNMPFEHPDFVFSTVIRHPFYRSISTDIGRRRDFPETNGIRGLNADFSRLMSSRNFYNDNYSVRWFAGAGRSHTAPNLREKRTMNINSSSSLADEFPAPPITKRHLAVAKNVLARLAVVVVMDDENPAWFKYSTEMLCKVLGYRECLQPRTRRPVVGARDSSPELKIMRGNETALAFYHKLARYDYEFFRFAKQLCFRQLRHYGLDIDPALLP